MKTPIRVVLLVLVIPGVFQFSPIKQAYGERLVDISTICLLDSGDCRTVDYVIEKIADAADRGEPDLVVAPLTPFLSFREGEEPADLEAFMSIARSRRTYLAVALVEHARDGKEYYTSVLIGRNGAIVGKYRKTHGLADDPEALGGDIPVFDTDFGKIGFGIGTDFYFPEVSWVEYMKGADILVWQHYPERFREHFQWIPLLKARALDCHAHMVTAMYADPRCYITNRHQSGMQGAAWGRSMILNRVGTPIADTGYEEGVVAAVVDLDKRKRDPYSEYEAENIFFVNNLGDRTAFSPLSEPWRPPS
ncbi:MAG: carbon-nitrogen hydrolase family protein, partial [Candidatus Latescibacteria bacterium]|nr:carbon-nitrogen hydrolase family protein [Candidatus Latescibacterota bacterium]